MTSMKVIQFSRPSSPLVYLCQKIFHSLDLGRLISDEPPSLQMITNQLKKKHKPRKTIICYEVLP